MIAVTETQPTGTPGEAGRRRLLSNFGEPLFIADWERALMIHYLVDRDRLQAVTPFELDLWDGKAFISLVAFTLRGMRPRVGGRLAASLFRAIATHDFLNVRTYVQHRNETGIYFLGEWLSNRLSVALGPLLFGLPYRLGKLDYEHNWQTHNLSGVVIDPVAKGRLAYLAEMQPGFEECATHSLTEWLMERYTAFTLMGGKRKFFRVWHAPWRQAPAQTRILDSSLLELSLALLC